MARADGFVVGVENLGIARAKGRRNPGTRASTNVSKNQLVCARCHLAGLASGIDCATQSSGESGAQSASVSRTNAQEALDAVHRTGVPARHRLLVADYTRSWRQVSPTGAKCYVSTIAMDETWSRTDQKRANRVKEDALARLSDDLARLGEAKLATLGLSEELLDARRDLEAHPERAGAEPAASTGARTAPRRGSFRRSGARDGAPRTRRACPQDRVDDERTRREANWILRLIGEGPSALDAFLLEFPQADRTHLKQLVRSVAKASHDRRLKAEAKLRIAIRGFLR